MFLFFRDWWDAYANPDAEAPEEAAAGARGTREAGVDMLRGGC